MTSVTGGRGAATIRPPERENTGPSAPGVALGTYLEPDSAEARVVDALFDCVARWGMAKTTVEDVARSAGISRATVHRLFPGGKGAILQAGLGSEITRLVGELNRQLEPLATLEEVLARAVSFSITEMREHRAFGQVPEHEWASIEKHLTFDRLDPVFLLAGAAFGPSLMRFLAPEDASHVAMWAARLVVSYLQSPSDDLDPGREDTARHLVVTYLLPGLEPAA